MEEIPRRCYDAGKEEKEALVVLGFDESDVEWIQNNLKDEHRTMYNPTLDTKDRDEEDLKKFLRKNSGCLVTCKSYLNGMECRTVVLVYDNCHASHFRSNFLRASHEVILIDRNTKEKAFKHPKELTTPMTLSG